MRTTTLRSISRARWLVGPALALATCWMTTDIASAAQPFAASGTWVPTSSETTNIRPVGSGRVVFFDQAEVDILSGTLDGSVDFKASCHVRVESLQGVCEGGETFTGTVAGRSGTARFHNVIFIDVATGASHGTFSIIGGTGGLANLRGHADTAGTPAGGTYTGQFHFAT